MWSRKVRQSTEKEGASGEVVEEELGHDNVDPPSAVMLQSGLDFETVEVW